MNFSILYHLNCKKKKKKSKNILVRSKLVFYKHINFNRLSLSRDFFRAAVISVSPRISLKRSLLSLVAGNHMSLCPCANIAFLNLVIKIYIHILYFTILNKNGYKVGSKTKFYTVLDLKRKHWPLLQFPPYYFFSELSNFIKLLYSGNYFVNFAIIE